MDGVLVYDCSHWGVLKICGDDRLRYLHNQSTNDFHCLQPGQGCDTVFVTSTARTIDLVTAYVLEDCVLLLVSPTRRQLLLQWLDRFIFPADRVEVADVTAQCASLRVIGSDSRALLESLGVDPSQLSGKDGKHDTVTLAQVTCRLALGSGLALPGYTLLLPPSHLPTVLNALTQAGAVPIDHAAWETLRIQQGRPIPDAELTDDYNPLEAGLWHTISFDKGCYIGQETIARLNTYKGVKQHLWGIRLSTPAAVGSPIKIGDEKIGVLTSVTESAITTTSSDDQNSQHWLGLAYIRTKAGGAGLSVQVGQAQGEIIDVAFLSRSPE